jgi:hypothetical protein
MNSIKETLSQVVRRGGHSESDLPVHAVPVPVRTGGGQELRLDALVRVRALGLRLAGIAGCELASRR